MRTRTTIAGLFPACLLIGWLAVPGSPAEDGPAVRERPAGFEGGFPTAVASNLARDAADRQRAVTAYRFWYPTVSCEGIFNGNRAAGLADNVSMPILSAGPRHVGFTLNSDTPYGGGVLDLKAGPMVVDLPPGPFIGLANDHHQRWIMDMGLAGPDGGKGGKHLILPPGYGGEVPKGYHVGRSSSFKVLLALRSMPVKGDVAKAMARLREVAVYSLSTADEPKPMTYKDMSKEKMDCSCLAWEDGLKFWEKLHDVIDAEPVVREYRPMYGLLAALGIEKGKPFAPDARTKAIMTGAAKEGRAQMLVSAFASERPDRIAWKDRRWEWIGLIPDNADFETKAGMDLEARDRWFAQAIVASPAMFRRKAGAGSLYWLGLRDRDGAYLDGGKTYRLAVPHPVPAGLFWSVTVYDAATRSEVRTTQDKAAIGSLFARLEPNADGVVVLSFGPKAPKGKDRWIQTTPGKGWFAYFRIYGPTASAFDGSWKPGDFVVEK